MKAPLGQVQLHLMYDRRAGELQGPQGPAERPHLHPQSHPCRGAEACCLEALRASCCRQSACMTWTATASRGLQWQECHSCLKLRLPAGNHSSNHHYARWLRPQRVPGGVLKLVMLCDLPAGNTPSWLLSKPEGLEVSSQQRCTLVPPVLRCAWVPHRLPWCSALIRGLCDCRCAQIQTPACLWQRSRCTSRILCR